MKVGLIQTRTPASQEAALAHVLPLVRVLDHHVLNEVDGLANPTSEHLAAWLWTRIRAGLSVLAEVHVAETPTSRCVYRGE